MPSLSLTHHTPSLHPHIPFPITIPRLALRYTDARPDALTVSATGTGGLSEFVSTLESNEAVFGYIRVTIGNDEYSQRAKFVFVRWCGPETKVMRKARLGIQSGEVKEVLRNFAVEVHAESKGELEEGRIMGMVRRAMGANCEFFCACL